jgi:HEAT repeat protein
MRPRVLIITAALAASILLPAIFYHRAAAGAAQAVPDVAKIETAPTPASGSRLLAYSQPARRSVPRTDNGADASAADHDVYVAEHKAALSDLSTAHDPEALDTIVSELTNPDPAIRKAALHAAVDFGSPDAIPALQNELAWAEDPQEKVNIQNAIDFLRLPPAQPNGDDSSNP